MTTSLDNLIPTKLPFPWVVARKEPALVVLNEVVLSIGNGGMKKTIGLAIAVHQPERMNGDDWVQLVCARPDQPCLLADLEIARTLIFGPEHDAIYRIPKQSEQKDKRQATVWVKLEESSGIVVVKTL